MKPEHEEKMRNLVCILMVAALATAGCRTKTTVAIPDPLWHLDESGTALWRLRLDGVAYVFTGGIPRPASDVRRPTPFFLVPADAYDAKVLLLRLDPDRVSIRVSGVSFAGEKETKISESRIYRFVPSADNKWALEEISGPYTSTVTPLEMLDILGASLNRKIEQELNAERSDSP